MSLLSTLIADAARIDKTHNTNSVIIRLAITSTPFRAVLIHRLAAAIYRFSPAAGRILQQVNMILCGTDIDPRSSIGDGFLLQHPVGTVIGGGSEIGPGCTMMSGVVLGRRHVQGGESWSQYPKLGSDVLVGTGACILGDVKVGSRATIGAMALVLNDVPSDTVAVGNPAVSRTSSHTS